MNANIFGQGQAQGQGQGEDLGAKVLGQKPKPIILILELLSSYVTLFIMNEKPHISVLMQEVLESFSSVSIQTFVDGTLGAGGHAKAILEAHPEIESFYGFDQDPSALKIAAQTLQPWKEKVHLIHANFQTLSEHVQDPVDGILLDVGVSSMQLDQPERGFSFMEEGPLDMRMNTTQELTAAEIVNHWSAKELGRIFRDYGEEKRWRAASQAIEKARALKPIATTQDLVEVLKPVLFSRKKGFNPATLVFQALRICVNAELDVLAKVLPEAIQLLKPGGRLAVISFHSLEDRIVKRTFQDSASDKVNTSGIGGVFLDKEPIVNMVTRKPLVASDEECKENPRSRSAKLRVVEKR